jgi:endonuclease/exonuclease/phosphatase family metal-dependent hydrolase
MIPSVRDELRQDAAVPSVRVRIATYNIRSLRDDAAAVVRVIAALRADVVCVQEAPRFLFWRRRCDWLARRAGLRVIGGGRSAAANLLLAASPVVVVQTRDVLFSKDFGLHQRGLAMAEVTLNGTHLVVTGTHLDGSAGPRLRHIAELQRAVDSFSPPSVPTVVAGDINDIPGSPAWNVLTTRRSDAAAIRGIGDPLTNPARTPSRRIDAIFAGPPISVISCAAVASHDVVVASDHRPVVAELDVPAQTRDQVHATARDRRID